MDPTKLSGVEYIGVDEVAKAKGHDYMTVVYDMVSGPAHWCGDRQDSRSFYQFSKVNSERNSSRHKSSCHGYGTAYQKAVKEYLLSADIVLIVFM